MLKSLIHTAVTVCATLFPIASAHAETSERALSRWVQKVNNTMDAWAIDGTRAQAGTAQISFRRGADGRPTGIAIRRGSASTAAAAIEALKMIRNLPPLPKAYAPDQQVVLNFFVGESNNRAYRQTRNRMLASARLANIRLAANVEGVRLAALEPR